MATTVQHRRGLKATWASVNPILADGQFGFEKDTYRFKFGNGVDRWNDLPYQVFDGTVFGHRYRFSTATADADQGAGYAWLNDANVALATEAYFSITNHSGGDATAYLVRLDDSGETNDRGALRWQKSDDPDVYLEFKVTGVVVTAAGYVKVSVAYMGAAGNLALDDVIALHWEAKGSKGADGLGTFNADGSVAMTGDFNGGGYSITNVNLVDGRDVSADGARLDEIYRVNKYDGTTPPTANDDAADTSGNGLFALGSRWFDNTAKEVYVCVDATAMAAVWAKTTVDPAELGNAAFVTISGAADNYLPRFDGPTGNLQDSPVRVADDGGISGYAAELNEQAGTAYTLVAGDAGKTIVLDNAAAITLTVPNSLPKKFTCAILQAGAGQVTIVPEAGATLNNFDGHAKLAGQHAMATLLVTANAGAAAIWLMAGRTAA